MANSNKRKTWKSLSTSSTEEELSPDDKKLRCKSYTSSEINREQDQETSLDNMTAELVMPKLNLLSEKLERVESKLVVGSCRFTNIRACVKGVRCVHDVTIPQRV